MLAVNATTDASDSSTPKPANSALPASYSATSPSAAPSRVASHAPTAISQIADDAAQWRWKEPHERRRGQYPLLLGKFGVFQNVDDLNFVAPCEFVLAEPAQVGDCALRTRRLPGDVQFEDVFFQCVACSVTDGPAPESPLLSKCRLR